MRIRRATADDAEAIAAVHVRAWQQTYRGILPDEFLDGLSPAEWAIGRRRGLERNPNPTSCFVVETDGGDIIAFALCGANRTTDLPFKGEILAIYVLAERQNQGLGTRLMRACVGELAERGLASMVLWVAEANSRARSFYERLGGRFVGRKTDSVGGIDLAEVAYGWPALPTIAEDVAHR
jgi:ribosomal protein S18 acetylase RimI-like enzyme